MLDNIQKIVSDPKTYTPLAFTRLFARFQKKCAPFLARSAFFMQGQMDIHPRSIWHNPAFCRETGGFFLPNDHIERRVVELEPWDLVRRDMLILLLRSIVDRNVEGDLAELGVWKGSTAKLIHHYLPERRLHLFDTFGGFDTRDIKSEQIATGFKVDATAFSDTGVDAVMKYICPKNNNVACYPGYFPSSIPSDFSERSFAFVHLDADLYTPIMVGLEYFYQRVTRGGCIVIHDYNAWPGARKAVNDFFQDKQEVPIPMPDKSGSALVVKQ
jgi:O-methyltransferase